MCVCVCVSLIKINLNGVSKVENSAGNDHRALTMTFEVKG